jgi:hypothetical protein
MRTWIFKKKEPVRIKLHKSIKSIIIKYSGEADWPAENNRVFLTESDEQFDKVNITPKPFTLTAVYLNAMNLSTITVTSITATAVLIQILAYWWTGHFDRLAFCLIVVIFAAAKANYWLVKFRFERGYFGNEQEARDLVAFILKNSDEFDAGDGDYRVFDPHTTQFQKLPAWLPGSQTV